MKKVYVIANDYPWPTTTGGRLRMKHLLVFLKGAYENVVLVCPEPVNRIQELELCDEVLFFKPSVKSKTRNKLSKYPSMGLYYSNSELTDIVESISTEPNNPDLVFGNTYLAAMFQHHNLAYSIDISDLEVQRFRSLMGMGSLNSRISSLIEWTKALHWEDKTLEKAKMLMTCSETDYLKTASLYKSVLFLSNEVFLQKQDYVPSPGNSHVLIFGNWEYPPNQDGVFDFLNQVWPRVVEKRPESLLIIAGRGSNNLKFSMMQNRRLKVLGDYSELSKLTIDCDLIVFPTNHGGGQQLKVVEGLNHNRVSILSQHSMRSIGDRVKRNCIPIRNNFDYAQSIIEMLENHSLRRSIEETIELRGSQTTLEAKRAEFRTLYEA